MKREKVIKGLEDSLKNQGCGYMDGVGELYAVSGEDLHNALVLLKEQEEQIKNRDESLEKAREEIKWLRGILKEQEAKTGHWIFESQYYEAWSHKCSECGKRMTTAVNTFANWCWNCGAKMTDRR